MLALRRYLRLLDTSFGTELRQTVRPLRNPGPRKIIAKPDEAQRLFAMAQPYMRLWLLLCSQLALRNASARSISEKDYDPEKKLIAFKQKGGTTHVLPVTDEIAAMFQHAPAAPQGADWTYVERWRGRKITAVAMWYLWRALKKKAGVRPDLRAHDLRRTTAVSLYQLTKDIRAVSHLLGHASISSTVGYLAHQDPHELRPLLAQLKPPTKMTQ